MRNIVFGTVLFVIVTSLSAFIYLYYFVDLIPVKFSSNHPSIDIVKTNSKTFDIYSNLVLGIASKDIWNVKPKVVGVFYTDKIRPDNPKIIDSFTQDLGATIDVTNENEVLIYIYASNNIIEGENPDKIIKEYTIETIKYYQWLDNTTNNDIYSKLIPLPINVKNN